MTDDLISRQAAIDALRVAYFDDNIQSAKDDPCIVDAMADWAIRQVKALPSAQSEPDLEWRKKHYKTAYNQGFVDGCKLYERQSWRREGKWLDNETTFALDVPQTCTCSVCRLRSRRPVGDFCKWCGAKMVE